MIKMSRTLSWLFFGEKAWWVCEPGARNRALTQSCPLFLSGMTTVLAAIVPIPEDPREEGEKNLKETRPRASSSLGK